jgi:hypothetical protein
MEPVRRTASKGDPAAGIVVIKLLLVIGALFIVGGAALRTYYSVPAEASWMVGKMPALRRS